MKQFDESVPQTLGEILIRHGLAPLTDAKLCENFLKDYCGAFKEEISLLVLAVKERVASDLLVSQDGLQRDLLRALLVKRLRKGRTLNEGDARWAVDAWSRAIRAFSRSESKLATDDLPSIGNPAPSKPWPRSGVIAQFSKAVRSLAVSGELMACGGDDGTISLLQPHCITTLKECDAPVSAMAFSPNGVLIAAASGPSIEILDLHSGEAKLLGQIGKQPSLAFSPGGKSLASASGEGRCEIQVWNLQTGQTRVLKGEWSGPRSISFSPDGHHLAAADSDRSNPSIRVWDLESGTMRVLGGATRQITSIAFLAGGNELASGSWDETVRLWNVRTGEARILGENCSCVCRLAISLQSEKLAAHSLDGRIRVWDLSSARSRTIGEYPGLNALSFLTDSSLLITGSDDGAVRIWTTNI